MPPIAVFRFSPTEGPAHFAEWLDAERLPWQLVAIDRGDAVPDDPREFAGIDMTGGLVETWCRTGAAELPDRSEGPLQSRDDILRNADTRVRELNAIADHIYARWATRLSG